MALSDCYMVRDIQAFKGEEILNVYFYQDTTTVSTAEQMVGAFIAQMLPDILALQSASLKHTAIDAVNLADPSNFFEEIISDTGGNGGDALPAFNALNFSLRLNSRALRPGSKRIGGLPEAAQVDGEVTSAPYLALIETVRLNMFEVLTEGGVPTYHPIVIKRVQYDVPDTDPVRTAYRLPESDGEFVFGDVVGCLTTPHLSHQVSRGNGR